MDGDDIIGDMTEEAGTRKIARSTLDPAAKDDSKLTPEEIDGIADLFASQPAEDDEDTGEFEPVKGDDPDLKPVED